VKSYIDAIKLLHHALIEESEELIGWSREAIEKELKVVETAIKFTDYKMVSSLLELTEKLKIARYNGQEVQVMERCD
jgi:hypothetical protein